MRFLLVLLLSTIVWAKPAWVRQNCGGGVSLEFPKQPQLRVEKRDPNDISYTCTYAGQRYWMRSFPAAYRDEQRGFDNLKSNLSEFGPVERTKIRKGRYYGYRFTIEGDHPHHVLWVLDNKRWVQVWAPANSIGKRFVDSVRLP